MNLEKVMRAGLLWGMNRSRTSLLRGGASLYLGRLLLVDDDEARRG
jgi:hypothetical protein